MSFALRFKILLLFLRRSIIKFKKEFVRFFLNIFKYQASILSFDSKRAISLHNWTIYSSNWKEDPNSPSFQTFSQQFANKIADNEDQQGEIKSVFLSFPPCTLVEQVSLPSEHSQIRGSSWLRNVERKKVRPVALSYHRRHVTWRGWASKRLAHRGGGL